MAEFGVAVFLAMLLAVASLRRDAIITMMIIAGSWLAWCGFILLTKIYEPWQFGILLDSLAAWFLLRHPSNRPKAIVGAIFCVQVAMHIAYGTVLLTAGAADWQVYYDQTAMTGWAQLLVAGAWSGDSFLRRVVPWWDRIPVLGNRSHRRDLGRPS